LKSTWPISIPAKLLDFDIENVPKKAKTGNYISLKKLEHDDNSQDVILLAKTPLIAKVNNKSLKLINNERYIIKKVLVPSRELIVENVRQVVKRDDEGVLLTDQDGNIIMHTITKTLTIKADEFQNLFRSYYSCRSKQSDPNFLAIIFPKLQTS
jgi:hypothetical protein